MSIHFENELSRVFPKPEEAAVILKCLERRIGKTAIESVSWELEIPQALSFWKAVRDFPNAAAQSVLRFRKRGKLDYYGTCEAEKLANELFAIRSLFLKRFSLRPNRYVRIVSHLETLPSAVLRRLFWFENIDFQSFESFLVRITPEQEEAVREHSEIFLENYPFSENREWKEYPCFSEGWQNSIANAFEKPSEQWKNRHSVLNENRYDGRAAIAHNLFGWDFGFKLYSDEKSDKPNPTSLAMQPLLSVRGEEFSVNTESRGAYWWLYKTLRNNPIWGSGEVELRSHVCPGFWMTVFAWALFLFVSPACLAFGLFSFEEAYGKLAIAFGSVTPGILISLAFAWFMAKFGDEYDKKFVLGSIATAICVLIVAVLGTGIFVLAAKADWGEPVNWLICAIIPLWSGFCVSKKDFVWPWEMPVIGPLLLAPLVIRSVWVGFERHPDEMFEALKFFGSIIIAVSVLAAIVLLAYLAVWFLGYAARKVAALTYELGDKPCKAAMNEGASKAEEEIKRSTYVCYALCAVAVAVLVALAYVMYSSVSYYGYSSLPPYFIAFLVIYGASFAAMFFWYGAKSLPNLNEKAVDAAVIRRISYYPNRADFTNAIILSPAFKKGFGQFDAQLLAFVLDSRNFKKCLWRMEDAEIAKMLESMTPESARYFVAAETKTHLLPYVARGLPLGKARTEYLKDQVREAHERKKRQEEELRSKQNIEEFKKSVKDFFMFVPRFVMMVVKTFGLLKRTFDKHCPYVYRSKPVN